MRIYPHFCFNIMLLNQLTPIVYLRIFHKIAVSTAIVFGFNIQCAFAQSSIKNPIDFNDYKPIYSEGELPANLKTLSSKKALEAMRRIQNSGKTGRERKTEESHAVEVSFFEDQILASGQVLFGNPMTDYVEKVGQNLLKEQKDLQNEIQFYVLRSHVPNAYTTSNGLIFVSVGLLVRLENESQLAVILAHEIQHYVKKHSLLQYKESKKAMTSSSRNSSFEDRLRSIYRFSKDQEFEADDLGYEMLKNTKYDLNEGVYVFEMLKYTDYPFLETPISIDSFASSNYVFPNSVRDLAAASITSVIQTEEKKKATESDESESTHPSLSQRILVLRDRIAKMDMTGKQKFIVDEKGFHFMQKVARHELLLLYLRRADYGQALYLSKVMELLYGKSLFLSKVRAMSIYALAEHRFRGKDLKDFGCSVSDNKGEWRNLFAGINSLTDKELGTLAVKIIWEEWSKYPKDEFLIDARDRSFITLQMKGKVLLNDFLAFVPYSDRNKTNATSAVEINPNASQVVQANPKTGTTEAPKEDNNAGLLKNPRSRSQTGATSSTSNTSVVSNLELPYFYGAFADVKNKSELKQYFDKIKIDFDLLTNRSGEKLSPSALRAKREKLEKEKYIKPNPDFTGIVVFQPQVTYSNGLSSSQKKKYFAEEKFRKNITQLWMAVAKTSNMNVKILENAAGSDLSTSSINDYAQLSDWMMERLNNDTIQMLLFYSQYIQEHMVDYQTTLLGWSGVDYKVIPRDFEIEYLIYSIFFYPMLPYYLYWQLQSDNYLKEHFVVYDTKSSKVVYQKTKYFETKVTDALLKAQIYESLYELKHTR